MSTSQPTLLRGSCQCGGVAYASTKLPANFTNCHCKTCRKLSGAPFLTFGDLPRDAITWTSGELFLAKASYSDLAERAHCSKCGSHIYMTYKCEPDFIGITAGTIDEDSVRGHLPKVKHHIFVGEEKTTAWGLPDDNIPRYPGFSTEFQKKLDTWRSAQAIPMS